MSRNTYSLIAMAAVFVAFSCGSDEDSGNPGKPPPCESNKDSGDSGNTPPCENDKVSGNPRVSRLCGAVCAAHDRLGCREIPGGSLQACLIACDMSWQVELILAQGDESALCLAEAADLATNCDWRCHETGVLDYDVNACEAEYDAWGQCAWGEGDVPDWVDWDERRRNLVLGVGL